MHHHYEDITSRIKEAPTWWDTNGVPRYGKFHPDASPNIYAEEVVLVRIACQACGKEFDVEQNWHQYSELDSFSQRIESWKSKEGKRWPPVHYGDPPFHGCVGDTMNCDDLKILGLWRQEAFSREWKRLKRCEVEMEEKTTPERPRLVTIKDEDG